MRESRTPLLKTGTLGTTYLPMQFAITFRQVARGLRLALLDLAPTGLPEAPPPRHFLVTPSGETRNCSRVRMQVIQHHGCRCCHCGRLGDEITLQICPGRIREGHLETLVALCGRCQSVK
jgi:hypothetical protein